MVLAFSWWGTARGFTGGHGLVADLAVAALVAVLTAGGIYGLLRAIDVLYAAGVLRGR